MLANLFKLFKKKKPIYQVMVFSNNGEGKFFDNCVAIREGSLEELSRGQDAEKYHGYIVRVYKAAE